jgi:hypothetical protein
MVLPDRIELSTSPLPMECSTTELRQHARYSGNRPKRLPPSGRFLPQGPLWRKHVGGSGTTQNGQKSVRTAASRFNRVNPGPIRFPSALSRRIMTSIALPHADGRSRDVATSQNGRLQPDEATPTMFRQGVAASRQILFRSKSCFDQGQFRRTCDEGRSRQRHKKDRRGCEGFTTGPAEAGAARKSQAAKVPGEGAQRCRRRIFRKRRRLPR